MPGNLNAENVTDFQSGETKRKPDSSNYDTTTIEHNTSLEPPLIRLPAELRNQIYDIVGAFEVQNYNGSKRLPNLLAVSRQIRAEFSSHYFSDRFMTAELWDKRSKT